MKSTVVVGYDRTPPSERALIEAGREAAWRGAELVVVHAYDWISEAAPMAYSVPPTEQAVRKKAEQIAEHGAELVRSRYAEMTVHPVAKSGFAGASLADASRHADLLVVGNRGRGGFASLMLGSVSLRAVTHASCPTMVVRGDEHEPREVVVAAIDLEDPGDAMLNFAFAEAARRSARLRALTVWDMSSARMYIGDTEEVRKASAEALARAGTLLDRVLYTWRAQYPEVRVETEVTDGAPGAVLTAAAQQADLVVVGAHRHDDGRDGVRLGPIAHTLLHHADCPVVVVPRS